MNPNKYILAILLLPCCINAQNAISGGTVILLFCDSSQVVVAADSRQVINDSIPSRNNVCKIHVFGNVVFVNAGIDSVFTQDGKNTFSMLKIAKESYSPQSTLHEIEVRFIIAAGHAYDSLVHSIGKVDSITFKKLLNRLAFSTAWLGMYKGQIHFVMRDWYPVLRENGEVVGVNPSANYVNCTDFPMPFFFPLGINGISKRCIDAETAKRMLKKFGVVNGMVRLIQNDIAFAPLFVGEPIDVLTFDTTGPHWQVRKPECRECEECPENRVKGVR